MMMSDPPTSSPLTNSCGMVGQSDSELSSWRMRGSGRMSTAANGTSSAWSAAEARALKALREAGAPVTTVDVLPDPAIRQELSALSGWPTIPQLFVKGELIGGADIAQELSESGELTQILADKLGPDYRDGAEERVVNVLDGAAA